MKKLLKQLTAEAFKGKYSIPNKHLAALAKQEATLVGNKPQIKRK